MRKMSHPLQRLFRPLTQARGCAAGLSGGGDAECRGFCYPVFMSTFTFLYRCPKTGLDVQAWTIEDPAEGQGNHMSYEQVACTACTRTHFVNPKTGKVLGGDDE